MSPSPGRVLAAAFLIALGACADRSEDAEKKPEAAPTAAAPDAMCAEHGVLEAVCPKCHPKLASIFQAKGDWCAEHGFPESFCPTCHPNQGGRPAVDVAATDGAPPDGTRVVLRTQEAVRAAGIEAVAARAPDANASLSVLASIQYDAMRRAEINPRLTGLVREVHVDVGTRVSRGKPLFTIESAELGAVNSRLAASRARLRSAELGRERVQRLFDEGMAPRKDLLDVELEAEAARADIAASQAALGLLEVRADAPNAYALSTPIDGVVVRVSAVAGRMVDAEEILAEVVDTSSMWVDLEIPERDVGRVSVGRAVHVNVDTLGDRTFDGSIDYVAPEVDKRTRTVKARARLTNADGMLRAGMFARATIDLGATSARSIVPIDAVQRAGEVAMVFVRLGEDTYETRRVKVGARVTNGVEITQGIEAGELVATRGSFLLKTETLKGSIGAGCCEVE